MGYSSEHRDHSPAHRHRERYRDRSVERELSRGGHGGERRKQRSRSRSPRRAPPGMTDDRSWDDKYKDDIRQNGHGPRHRRPSGEWRQDVHDQQERFFEK